MLSLPSGWQQQERSYWGIGPAAKTLRAQLRHEVEKNPARRGLWPFQLIQLIYLCGSAEREKWMDVCFLLTLYI